MNNLTASQKILVTGGAGFIGQHLVRKLAHKGFEVTVLDLLSQQIHGLSNKHYNPFESLPSVRFIRGDLCCSETLLKALAGIQTVVHLAAETGTGQSMYSLSSYASTNVGGTAALLDLLANNKLDVQRIVLASSRAVYGEGKYSCPEHGSQYPSARLPEMMSEGHFDHNCPICDRTLVPQPTDECSPLAPSSLYGITKLSQEQLVMAVSQALGISACSLRFQNVYGPGQSLSNPYTGILSIFSNRMRLGLPINIFEDGEESRDFVYIEDVVDAILLSINEPVLSNNILNVGSGKLHSVLSIAQQLHAKLNSSSEIKVSGQFRLGDIRNNFADLRAISHALKWQPKTPFPVGLQSFVDWVTEEPLGNDTYELSLSELRSRGLFK